MAFIDTAPPEGAVGKTYMFECTVQELDFPHRFTVCVEASCWEEAVQKVAITFPYPEFEIRSCRSLYVVSSPLTSEGEEK